VLAQSAVTPRDDAAARAHAHLTADGVASSDAGSGLTRALRWLLTGTIRIPVPLGLAAAVIAAVWLYVATTGGRSPGPDDAAETDPVVSLADFEPVEERSRVVIQ
jgi:hypothetical protein